MTPVIVYDASCLIDLQKGGLLNVIYKLPHRIVIPHPVRKWELTRLSEHEWKMLDDAGTITHYPNLDQFRQSLKLKARHNTLSETDCFCIVTTQIYSGILLTGDAQLRKVAESRGIQVHGALWVIDQLHSTEVCSIQLLIRALKVWYEEKHVFLPKHEISSRLNNWK